MNYLTCAFNVCIFTHYIGVILNINCVSGYFMIVKNALYELYAQAMIQIDLVSSYKYTLKRNT